MAVEGQEILNAYLSLKYISGVSMDAAQLKHAGTCLEVTDWAITIGISVSTVSPLAISSGKQISMLSMTVELA